MIFAIFLTPNETHTFIDTPALLKNIIPSSIISPEYILINGALLVFLFYALYYLTLDFNTAIFFDVFLLFLYVQANSFYLTYGAASLKYALFLHVLGWYMQIHPGHTIFEGRKPALLDSFFQSLILAPLFVFYELLFWLGFKKELFTKIQKRVQSNIQEWKKSQTKNK